MRALLLTALTACTMETMGAPPDGGHATIDAKAPESPPNSTRVTCNLTHTETMTTSGVTSITITSFALIDATTSDVVEMCGFLVTPPNVRCPSGTTCSSSGDALYAFDDPSLGNCSRGHGGRFQDGKLVVYCGQSWSVVSSSTSTIGSYSWKTITVLR